MDIKKIYICHTFYHVYSTLLKEVQTPRTSDIVICDTIPTCKELIERLCKANIFNNIIFFSDKHTELMFPKSSNLLSYMACHKYVKEEVNKSFKIDITLYEEVNIYNDWTVMGKYLQSCKKKYRLIEDGFNVNKTVYKHKDYMGNKYKLKLKQTFNIVFLPFGLSKFVQSIEVNENKDLKIPFLDKVVEVPRQALIDNLSQDQKKIIFNVFTDKIDGILAEKKILILTQPLYADKDVSTEEKQISYYRKMVNQYKDEYLICIKPHPRDLVEYDKIFENSVIIDKNIPIEIMNFEKDFYFDIGITVYSTAIDTIYNIGKRISVGL